MGESDLRLSLKRYLWIFTLVIIGGTGLNLKRPAISLSFEAKTQPLYSQKTEKSTVHLYFSDRENAFLIAEQRELIHAADPADLGKSIIEALIEGPKKGLTRTLPAETIIRAFYITGDATAYVDIANSVKEQHPGGCKSELISIYSIVNSLILNLSNVDAVKILVGGRESLSLAGHVDLRFAFKANMLLIR
jgi:hypothetical protein